MPKFLLTLTLFFCSLISFAQQTTPEKKDPCDHLVLEMFNAQNQKLPEGAKPVGKVSFVVRQSYLCNHQQKFKVAKLEIYLQEGAVTYSRVLVSGNAFDFTSLESKYKPENRILVEATTAESGKSAMKSWTFKR
ncbi:MAG: hypothetical protein ACO1O1_12370 [Adhaeribacter sp.]